MPVDPAGGAALKQKIALFTNVAPDAVFSAEDVDCIYEVPAKFHKQGVDEKIAELLNIWSRAPELTGWEQVVERMRSPQSEVEIALVGKYVELGESYKSFNEAIMHGGIANDCRVHLRHVDSRRSNARGQAASTPPMASWSRRASARAAARARSRPRAMRARRVCPTSASAWVCR